MEDFIVWLLASLLLAFIIVLLTLIVLLLAKPRDKLHILTVRIDFVCPLLIKVSQVSARMLDLLAQLSLFVLLFLSTLRGNLTGCGSGDIG